MAGRLTTIVFLVFLSLCCSFIRCDKEILFNPEVDTSVDVTLGEEFTLKIKGNLTTGYAWEVLEDNKNFNVIRQEYLMDEEELNAGKTVGVGGYHYISMKALSKGSFVINLIKKRAWEDEVLKSIKVAVNVYSEDN